MKLLRPGSYTEPERRAGFAVLIAAACVVTSLTPARAAATDFPYKVLSTWHESQKVFALARTPDVGGGPASVWAGAATDAGRVDGLAPE